MFTFSTLTDIEAMLKETGLPVAYSQFEASHKNPVSPPFIVFTLPEKDTFSADNGLFVDIYTMVIELYSDDPDLSISDKLESVLTSHGISFSLVSQYWIDTEQMYETSYTMEVIRNANSSKQS